MQVEYDPRSESFRVWCSNQDDYNFMKLVQSPAFSPRKFFKTNLNSIYGKMIYADTDSIHFIDGKENNKMTRDYIVVHIEEEPTIIFKNHIVCISKDEDRAYIQCTSTGYYVEESYASVVKQLV